MATPLPPAEHDNTLPMVMNMVRTALKRSHAFVSETFSKPLKKVRFDDEATDADQNLMPTTSSLAPDADEVARDTADDHDRLTLIHTLIAIRYVSEPTSYNEAMASEQANEWLKAARSEVQSLNENQTWKLVPRPPGRKILKNRWVWVVKYNGKGEIDRLKARLVIKGFLQQYGIDYNEIFAPVIRMEVLRLLLTIAAMLDFEIHQMDVKTAFLNGYLDEEIYMEQPEGFVKPGQEHLVCKLLKSL